MSFKMHDATRDRTSVKAAEILTTDDWESDNFHCTRRNDEFIFWKTEDTPRGTGVVALEARCDYLIVTVRERTYISDPGPCRRVAVPVFEIEDSDPNTEVTIEARDMYFTGGQVTEVYDRREEWLKFGVDSSGLVPHFSGFCPVVTPKRLVRPNKDAIAWNMDMRQREVGKWQTGPYDLRSDGLHCLVNMDRWTKERKELGDGEEWDITTDQEFKNLNIKGTHITLKWSTDAARKCICFEFYETIQPKKTKTKRGSSRKPGSRTSRSVGGGEKYLIPCIASVSLNGKKKGSFGFISTWNSVKVRFYEEDFGFDFEKLCRISFSLHKCSWNGVPKETDSFGPECYEYFAPECYLDISSPFHRNVFRMLLMIMLWQPSFLVPELYEKLCEFIWDPMIVSARDIVTFYLQKCLGDDDCAMQDMAASDIVPSLLKQLTNTEIQNELEDYEEGDDPRPQLCRVASHSGKVEGLVSRYVLLGASINGMDLVSPDQVIGKEFARDNNSILIYLLPQPKADARLRKSLEQLK